MENFKVTLWGIGYALPETISKFTPRKITLSPISMEVENGVVFER